MSYSSFSSRTVFLSLVDPQYAAEMHKTITKYRKARQESRILLLDFVTLSDYLFKLQSGTRILARLQQKVMYYLAAAVSDFFIPSQKMAGYTHTFPIYLAST